MLMKRALLFVLVLVAFAAPVLAQDTTLTTADPNANISWPPPVYVLRGEFEIRGSANLPNMTNYFIDYRSLEEELDEGQEPVYFPAILPSRIAVLDDVLGVWDTTETPDGLYELRLTVNVRGGRPVVHTVSPLRVENEPPPFAGLDGGIAAPTQAPAVLPTAIVLPTATVAATQDPTPRATVTVNNANVRTGDGTNYPAFASLAQGAVVSVVGVSNRGTGWWQVRLPNGQIGWMAPSVVQVAGDIARVPRVAPPPPPATPTPTLTPTSVSQANLVAGIVQLNPAQPVCNQTFTIGFDVANLGTQATLTSGIVQVRDLRLADGSVQQTVAGGFPVLQPGQTFRVNIPITITTFFGEGHRLVLDIDPTNQVPETNNNDNQRTVDYVLQPGTCAGGGVTPPAGQVNLVVGNLFVNPFPPICNQQFVVGVDIANQGGANFSGPGSVLVQDVRIADGQVQQQATGTFGPINAGQTLRVDVPLTVSTWFNEDHRLVVTVDPNGQVGESNEGDNVNTITYNLQRGGC